MNRQIRWIGGFLVALFLAAFAKLNQVQIVDAAKLNRHPGNTRNVVRDFSEPRGTITSSDGTVLAESIPTSDSFQRLRRYPQGQLFSHVVGYFSFTYGNSGIEAIYNNELAGRTPKLELKSLSDLFLDKKRTANVTLTLSSRLQQVAAQALGPRPGAVVALDPKTGAILAMVDYPTFDPNPLAAHDQKRERDTWTLLNLDTAHPLLPRAYAERFAPGSSFKVVTATTALENGATDTSPTFPVLRQLPLPQTTFPLANFGHEACGGNLRDGLVVSCNTTYAAEGLQLGGDKLSAGVRGFGFDTRPPLDVENPRATVSVFPDATAFAHDLPALAKSAIGQQDVFASPLQMALIAAAIANNGVIMTPHLMAEIRDSEATLVRSYQPRPWVQATTSPVAATVRSMMEDVVTRGTGTNAQIPGVVVAGKTGTAQTGRNTVEAWFVSFAPADDPKVAVAVLVQDQPDNGEATGGAVAAPIAKAVLQAALSP